MSPLRISAVSYLNTFPFVYGIKRSGLIDNFRMELDVPSVCAEKLRRGDVDVALVPVGAIPDLQGPEIVSRYCIGSVGNVKTVLLLSQVTLEKIDNIHLDCDSGTSVKLVRVLAEKFWKISPEWTPLNPGQLGNPYLYPSVVAIGDKTFDLVNRYRYVYDLAAEWIRFTSLPFVFAAWLRIGHVEQERLEAMNSALAWGIARKAEALDFFKDKLPPCGDCLNYLEENISYDLDDKKKAGMKLFLKYLAELG